METTIRDGQILWVVMATRKCLLGLEVKPHRVFTVKFQAEAHIRKMEAVEGQQFNFFLEEVEAQIED